MTHQTSIDLALLLEAAEKVQFTEKDIEDTKQRMRELNERFAQQARDRHPGKEFMERTYNYGALYD